MPATGEHNKWIALALCILVGYLGIHRFYEGKMWTGVLWLCTAGLFGVGVVVDAILIILKPEHYQLDERTPQAATDERREK